MIIEKDTSILRNNKYIVVRERQYIDDDEYNRIQSATRMGMIKKVVQTYVKMLDNREKHYHLIQRRQFDLLKSYENNDLRNALSVQEHLDWLVPKLHTMDRDLGVYLNKYRNVLEKFIK